MTDSTPPLAGLLVRGAVLRRWRKTLESGVEVVYYDVEGTTVQMYRPRDYFAIGAVIEVPVRVSLYTTKTGSRYNLVIPSPEEGEF
jgi:hypothetical protein